MTRQTQWADLHDHLPGDSEGLSGRSQNTEGRDPTKQRHDDSGCHPQDVLTVVDDQQHATGHQSLGELLDRRTSGLAHAQGGAEGLGRARLVGDGGQIDEPDAVMKAVNLGPGRLDGEPSLAGATRTGESYEPVVPQVPVDQQHVVVSFLPYR